MERKAKNKDSHESKWAVVSYYDCHCTHKPQYFALLLELHNAIQNSVIFFPDAFYGFALIWCSLALSFTLHLSSLLQLFQLPAIRFYLSIAYSILYNAGSIELMVPIGGLVSPVFIQSSWSKHMASSNKTRNVSHIKCNTDLVFNQSENLSNTSQKKRNNRPSIASCGSGTAVWVICFWVAYSCARELSSPLLPAIRFVRFFLLTSHMSYLMCVRWFVTFSVCLYVNWFESHTSTTLSECINGWKKRRSV